MPPLLVAGLNNTADSVDLSDGQNTFIISEPMQAADNEQLPGMVNFALHPRGQYAAAVTQPSNTVSVQMSVFISSPVVGSTPQTNVIELLWQSIEWKLEQAIKAAAASPVGTPIYFAHHIDGAAEQTMYQVVDGTFQFVPLSIPWGSPWKAGVLTLYVRPYGFGRQVADTVSGTLTNGALASVIARLGVPGVVEAMTKLLITDVSTGGVFINRIRGSVKASRPLPSGSWSPLYLWSATGAGVTHTDATATGGSCARLAGATSTFQTLAQVTSAAGANQNDTVDAWAVLRDSSTPLTSPAWPATSALTAGTSGSLLDGQYIVLATTHDGSGNESTPIGVQVVTVPLVQTTFFDGAEGTDFALWTALDFGFQGGGTVGNIVIDTESSYPLDAPGNQYGFHASSAVNVYSGTGTDVGFGLAYKTFPGGGNAGSMRYRLKINANQGTGQNIIPLVLDASNHPLLFFNTLGGSGWQLTDSVGSGPASCEFGQGSWIQSVEVDISAYNSGTGTFSVKLIVNNTTVVNALTCNQGTNGAPVRFCIGAYTAVNSTAGNNTSLDVYFDDVQMTNGSPPVGAPTGSIVIDWLAPSMGAGTGTNLYVQRNGGSWMQVATTGTSYTLTSNTAGTVVSGPPLGAPAMQAGLFRLLYGVNGALTPLTQIAPAISLGLPNQWQLVRLAQGIVLPPQPAQFGGSPQPWICQLQGASGGTNTPNLDAALLWLTPSGQDFAEICVPGAGLATLGQWQLDIDPSGYVSGLVFDAATGLTLQSAAVCSGQLTYGASDTIASFLAEVSDGSGHYIVDMVNAKYTVQALITPQYVTPTGVR